MEKEEILAKSRAENKNADLFQHELNMQAYSYAALASWILATLFFVIQIISGKGINWGLYAIAFSGNAASAWVKYVKLRNRRDLLHAILITLFVLVTSACHIYDLLAVPAIL